jgi:hypothetical protein
LWLRLWRRAAGPGEAERRALESWVRLRFRLAASDPMIAIIGAVRRLSEAGMTADDAIETVLRILQERTAAQPRSKLTVPHGLSPRKASLPGLRAL